MKSVVIVEAGGFVREGFIYEDIAESEKEIIGFERRVRWSTG